MKTMKARIFLSLLVLTVYGMSLAQPRGITKWISVPEENLRSAPSGKKIGSLLQNTEIVMIDEKDNWAKVQITGWIWKPSISSIRPKSGEGLMRAQHILVKTRDEAEEALNMIKQGQDFGQVAQEKSILPNAAQGGDLGYFKKGDFDPKIESTIEKLKVGEVSDILKTEIGFHIFKRLQ
jgi:hypothetical protein